MPKDNMLEKPTNGEDGTRLRRITKKISKESRTPTFWSKHDQITVNALANRAQDTPVDGPVFNTFLPHGVQIIREGMLEKRVVAGNQIHWYKRHVVLTTEKLYLVQEKCGQVKEDIDLVLITKVQRVSRLNTDRPQEGSQEDEESESPTRKHSYVSHLRKVGTFRDRVGSFRDRYNSVETSEGIAAHIKRNEALHVAEWENVIEILTEVYGRTYYLRNDSKNSCDKWVEDMDTAIQQARKAFDRNLNLTLEQRFRRTVAFWYNSRNTQVFIAMLLLINFFINLAETETKDPTTLTTIQRADQAFTFIYTVELFINMYSHQKTFFSSAWNIFDVIVVGISIFDVIYTATVRSEDTGADVKLLRVMRVVRVVRVFNKFEAMRRIIHAINDSIFPVLSAFLLVFVIISLYSILAVQTLERTSEETPTEEYEEAMEHYLLFYSSFSQSCVSLLGIATGSDSWTNAVKKLQTGGKMGFLDVLFFVSFLILVGIVGLNIIISVLLEAFLSSMANHEKQKSMDKETASHYKVAGALDPLLATLSNFTSPQHLQLQLDLIFSLFDLDEGGSVDYEEFCTGVHALSFVPRITLSREDWDDLSMGGALLCDDGGFSKERFEIAMRLQLAQYSQRLLASKMQHAILNKSEHVAILFALKMVMMEVLSVDAAKAISDLHEADANPAPTGYAQIEQPEIPRGRQGETAETAPRVKEQEKMLEGLRDDVGDLLSRVQTLERQVCVWCCCVSACVSACVPCCLCLQKCLVLQRQGGAGSSDKAHAQTQKNHEVMLKNHEATLKNHEATMQALQSLLEAHTNRGSSKQPPPHQLQSEPRDVPPPNRHTARQAQGATPSSVLTWFVGGSGAQDAGGGSARDGGEFLGAMPNPCGTERVYYVRDAQSAVHEVDGCHGGLQSPRTVEL